jgi:hypothetical protein
MRKYRSGPRLLRQRSRRCFHASPRLPPGHWNCRSCIRLALARTGPDQFLRLVPGAPGQFGLRRGWRSRIGGVGVWACRLIRSADRRVATASKGAGYRRIGLENPTLGTEQSFPLCRSAPGLARPLCAGRTVGAGRACESVYCQGRCILRRGQGGPSHTRPSRRNPIPFRNSWLVPVAGAEAGTSGRIRFPLRGLRDGQPTPPARARFACALAESGTGRRIRFRPPAPPPLARPLNQLRTFEKQY